MAEFPALKIWTDAYLGDTHHLSTLEHGAYYLLLLTAWRSTDCDLPDDDKMLARYTRLTMRQWRRIRPTIEAFWTIENGRWWQGKLRDERDVVRQHSKSQSVKGKASALKRKNRDAAAVGSRFNRNSTSQSHPHSTDVSSLSYDKENPSGENSPSNGHDLTDIDAVYFREGKALLGQKAGGVLKRLKDKRGLEGAQSVLRQAADKQSPMEYIQGVLRKQAPNAPRGNGRSKWAI